MNMKTFLLMGMAVAAMAASAAPSNKNRKPQPSAGRDEVETTGKEAMFRIDQFPRLGKQATLDAPIVGGGTTIGQCWAGKPRKWIVLESKYTTYAKTLDQLTFTWHVLLETKSATTKDKEDQEKLAPYSYFTQTVTYHNIPRGSHAASVCLHPSYLERFGEPKAVGLVIVNQNGDVLGGDVDSQITGIPAHPKSAESGFWNDQSIMNKRDAKGNPMIERRQGLQDRSKTIWALVNPNDYELVLQ